MKFTPLLLHASLVLIILQHAYAAMSQAQLKQAMKSVRNMCLPKSGASKEAVSNLQIGEFDESDRKVKCYLACAMGMMQAVKNNKISLNFVRSQVAKMLEPDFGARVIAAFESCQEATGEDNCDLAYKFAKCIYDTDKEAFLIP